MSDIIVKIFSSYKLNNEKFVRRLLFMEEKKKVLFSFVGSRDPYSDGKVKRLWKKFKGQETSSEGSVLTACRWLKPDIVYLFPSSKEKAAQTSTPENHT